MNYAADARAQKAERRDAEPETSAADKAVIRLVDISVVQRLPGSLSVPERKKNACRGEKILDDQRGDDRDRQPENALNQIISLLRPRTVTASRERNGYSICSAAKSSVILSP